jgi:hypothetical protein
LLFESVMRVTLLVCAVLASCTESQTTPHDVDADEAVVGEIALDAVTDTRIAGSYTRNGEVLEFDARELEPKLVAVTLKLHGLTIDATLDTRDGNRMWSQDAFATTTGEDTVITEDDAMFVEAFLKAIEAEKIGISVGDALGFHFGSVLGLWAQWTPAMDPVRIKFEDRDRAVDMCWWAGAPDRYHDYDGHDCDACSGDPGQGQGNTSCSSYVAYGPYYSGTTWYYNGSWVSGDDKMGHGNHSYQTGDCYGRYGAGCGDGRAYFRENGSHDHCVRNGHVTYSAWCSDELWSTTSAYNCW